MVSEKMDLDMLFSKIEPLLKELNGHLVSEKFTVANPKVSICLISYNHGAYLGDSLASIFSQKTNFNFEVVIGDDCSSDNTQEVIREYLKKYPDKMKCFFHPENLSRKYKEFTPGKLNFLHGLYNCSGEFIVHIEGDDYFTDELKLQKQVDFLEANVDCTACFHNALMKFENECSLDYLINKEDQKTRIYPTDLLVEKETWFMATASVMFRSDLLKELQFWFSKSKSGDIPLYVILSHKGPIGYIGEVMSVYRRDDNGMSYTDDRKHAAFVENRIFMFEHLNRQTEGKYKSQIKPILSEFYEMLAETVENKSSIMSRFKCILKSFMLSWPADNTVVLERFRKIFRPEIHQLKQLFK
jgi:glycosyltransferase involved in cell wall biosynthesis